VFVRKKIAPESQRRNYRKKPQIPTAFPELAPASRPQSEEGMNVDFEREEIEPSNICEDREEEDGWAEEDDWEDMNADETLYIPCLSTRPTFTGNYFPYFPSYTMAAMSFFLANSRLSRRNFNSLLRILKHSEFQLSDLPLSYNQCKKLLYGLPMLPIHTRNLTRNKESSYVDKKTMVPAFHHSVMDIIHRVLSTPSLRNEMYFGAGMKVESPKEFFHGTIWRESPMFGADCVTNATGEPLLNLVVG
jgi:hypothetical protein